jgi:tetratricopeptide (TPR) repeat protein
MVGFAVGMMGNPERGLEWTARAVADVDVVPRSVDSFTAYANHGCLLGMVGEHDTSKEFLEGALGIAISDGAVGSQYIALSNIAYGLLVKLQQGETLSSAQKKALASQALQYAERARKLCSAEDLGLDPGVTDSLVGQAMLHSGDVSRAKVMFTQALRQGLVHPGESAEAHLGIAIAHRLCEEYDDARAHLQVAHDIAGTGQLGLVLDRVMAEGVALESAAGNLSDALDWATGRCNVLEKQYKQRLRLLARSTELIAQADSVSQRASHYQQEAEALIARRRDWDDEASRVRSPTVQPKGTCAGRGPYLRAFPAVATVIIDIDNFPSLFET